jgi:hypothetical protein
MTTEHNLACRFHDWNRSQTEGTTPPPGAVNADDWWDLARWLLEHRRAAKVGANDSATVDQRHLAWKHVRLEVAQFMGLFSLEWTSRTAVDEAWRSRPVTCGSATFCTTSTA